MSKEDNMEKKIGQMQFKPDERLQERLDDKVFAKWQQYEQDLTGKPATNIGSHVMNTENKQTNKRFMKYVIRVAAAILLVGFIVHITMPNLSRVRRPALDVSSSSITLSNEARTSQIRRLDGYLDASQSELNKNYNTEAYDYIADNPFRAVKDSPLSTFSIDVDTASYANVRRFLRNSQMPPKDAVRIEELVNYFPYDYTGPSNDEPFAVNAEVCQCPWQSNHQLMRIGIKGKAMSQEELPASNLVFLLDVSGSMNSANKLPLLKRAMAMLVNELTEKDRVAIAVYAGSSGLVLPSTACTSANKRTIIDSLDRLNAGGSTHGEAGIQLAYKTASEYFIKGGINRVILATDGDFNVGTTHQGDLTRMIEEKAQSGVFLTVLGFGMGNYKDSTAETLADRGNGNYGYIDTILEAKKLLVEQRNSTLVTIAKDVKIQVEFNPAKVGAYRLIGYENRMLEAEDFNNDKKDAGEIGAGHTVTALYELVPVGVEVPNSSVDALTYQKPTKVTDQAKNSHELLTVKLRYKQPDGDTSRLIRFPVVETDNSFAHTSADFKFACSVASFGMLLRDSEHKSNASFESVLEMAKAGQGPDEVGYREEFIGLVKIARELSN